MSIATLLQDRAHLATYAGASGAITLWGLHLNELGVIVSSLAALCGAVIQVLTYLDRKRASERRKGDEETPSNGATDRRDPS